MLRMYVMNNPTMWEDYLNLLEFAYNTGYHISAKMSPFKYSMDESVEHWLLGISQWIGSC